MPCPTCSHTMTPIVQVNGVRYFHCGRCGTLYADRGEGTVSGAYPPLLVGRCRQFEELMPLVTAGDGRPWRSLGIAESIRPEGER